MASLKEIKIEKPQVFKIDPSKLQDISDYIKEYTINEIKSKWKVYTNNNFIEFLINDTGDLYTDIIKPYIIENMQYNHYEINNTLVRSSDNIDNKYIKIYLGNNKQLQSLFKKIILSFQLENTNFNELKSILIKEYINDSYDQDNNFRYIINDILDDNDGELWYSYIDEVIAIPAFGDYLIRNLNQSEMINENILKEYSDKTIKNTIERWKQTNPKLDNNISQQLIQRFDQIKNNLSSKLEIVVLSDELKQNNNYLDIDKYSYEDMSKLIKSLPENPDKVKKDAVERFSSKFYIDKPTAQSYTARFMTKRDNLKLAAKEGIEETGTTKEEVLNLIPKRLQMGDLFLDPRNWEWEPFEQMLDALFPSQKQVVDNSNTASLDGGDKVYDKNGIEIWKGDDVHKCISYNPTNPVTKNKTYGWCVTQPGNTNYDNYRFGANRPTFYFVFDRTLSDIRNKDKKALYTYPFHAFVVQVYNDGNTYVVTAADNLGDNQAKSWDGISTLVPLKTWAKIKDLKSYFKSIALSPVERAKIFAQGRQLTLYEFKELDQDEKILYVQGKASKNQISSDILEILPKYKISVEGRSTTLANVAIDSGQQFTYAALKNYETLAKRYAIFRFRHTDYSELPIPLPFVKYLDDEAKIKYLNTFEDNLSFELTEKYFGIDITKQKINEVAKKLDFIPQPWLKYIIDNKLQTLYNVYSKLYVNWTFGDDYNNDKSINSSNNMPEQIVSPRLLTEGQWLDLSNNEKKEIIKLIIKLDNNPKYLTFLYASPYLIKDGSQIYILLPRKNSNNMYESWILLDENNKIIKNNIDGTTSLLGDNLLIHGFFNQDEPKRIYSIDDINLETENISEANGLYEDWNKYQFMIRAGIIK
jgi:hypothetical protein